MEINKEQFKRLDDKAKAKILKYIALGIVRYINE